MPSPDLEEEEPQGIAAGAGVVDPSMLETQVVSLSPLAAACSAAAASSAAESGRSEDPGLDAMILEIEFLDIILGITIVDLQNLPSTEVTLPTFLAW